MKLYQGQPGTSDTLLYTAERRITSFTVIAANITASSATLRLNVCFAAAAAANTNIIIPDVNITPHTIVVFDLTIQLLAGDTIRALQGTSAAITLTIDGTDGTEPV